MPSVPLAERHALIEQIHTGHPDHSIRHLCQSLQVNRAWYYQRTKEPMMSEEEISLRDKIEEIILEYPGYGYRRVTHALQREGWYVNHKRVLRIMQEESLLCQLKRHFVRTTDSQHRCAVYPNLVKTRTIGAPNCLWVADITYIRLARGFVYLATLLDSYSRTCVGWKLSQWIDTQLVLDALENALVWRPVIPGWIHHSDRGVQYASTAYIHRLVGAGARVSMAATGNPYENAQAESFFKTLKREEVHLKEYQTFADAESNLRVFIEEVYNVKRLHSSIGYVPPLEFEAALNAKWRSPL